MKDAIDATSKNGNTDWFHATLAEGRAVSGVFIDMLAPQALRTMIGIAAPHYTYAAFLTRKIFDSSDKTFHS